jgi:hypothetical protein
MAQGSVHHAQVRASMRAAVMVLARQRAIKEAKHQLQAQGLRPTHLSHRDLLIRADQYLAEHREELIAVVTPIVERWQAEGFFGKRAQQAAST